MFCGERNGREITVTGDFAVLTFHSDTETQQKGFNFSFVAGEYNQNKYLPVNKCDRVGRDFANKNVIHFNYLSFLEFAIRRSSFRKVHCNQNNCSFALGSF